MRLTQYTDYALRVLMYLGLRGEQRVTITEIAERYTISRNHIMKVVFQLGQLDYVETTRGRNGGIRLQQSPEAINVGEVVRSMERNLDLVECFGADNQCCLTPACVLRGAVGEALAAFFAVLDRYTLADLLGPRDRLAAQLGLPTTQ